MFSPLNKLQNEGLKLHNFYLFHFQQPDATMIFQQDEMTSAMEVTKCITASLPSLNERSNDVIVSGIVPIDVAVALALNILSLDHTLQLKSFFN